MIASGNHTIIHAVMAVSHKAGSELSLFLALTMNRTLQSLSLALAGDARALHSGMTATGSHYDFRFAARSTTPFTQGSRGVRIVTGGNPWKGPHQCALH